jgi:hypothetical protein
MPPAWEPPNLLLVVGLHVVVRSVGRVVVVIDGSRWLRGSVIWSQQPGMGKKRKQSNREYSSKALARLTSELSIYATLLKEGLYLWTGLQKCQNREKA